MKAWAWWPEASSAARRKAQVEPLPLVPATWNTGGRRSCGRPKAIEQGENAVEAEVVGGVDRRSQPVELRLDRGIGRAREIGHQAAFLALPLSGTR